MKYISFCDGIGGAHVAWQPLGWECVGVSEIDPFCNAVVKHHWGFENFGALNEEETIERMDEISGMEVDVIVGGTPCQSFSVAGRRGGLQDGRGQLVLWFLYAVCRIRPRYVVWENVPGILSIDEGKTFRAFVSTLDEFGYFVEWRILDAQYFGVPQRRRRVFVVGHLTKKKTSYIVGLTSRERTRQVLYNAKSSYRDTETCLAARKKDQGTAQRVFTSTGGNVAGTLLSRYKGLMETDCILIRTFLGFHDDFNVLDDLKIGIVTIGEKIIIDKYRFFVKIFNCFHFTLLLHVSLSFPQSTVPPAQRNCFQWPRIVASRWPFGSCTGQACNRPGTPANARTRQGLIAAPCADRSRD
jgi:site-specific DNA-cytosine methylase